LPTAVAAAQTVQLIGLPEAQLTLAHATVHLASAPKSNAVRRRWGRDGGHQGSKAGLVPPHLRDGHYSGAAALGNAQGYLYRMMILMVLCRNSIHRMSGWVDYYRPTTHGAERDIAGRLDKLRAIIRRRRG